MKILLADDHNVMRTGLRVSLERQAGFKVVAEAANGRDAVAQAEVNKPDVAVLDFAMPDLSGVEPHSESTAGCRRSQSLF